MNNIGAFDLKIWGSATSSYYEGILSQEKTFLRSGGDLRTYAARINYVNYFFTGFLTDLHILNEETLKNTKSVCFLAKLMPFKHNMSWLEWAFCEEVEERKTGFCNKIGSLTTKIEDSNYVDVTGEEHVNEALE